MPEVQSGQGPNRPKSGPSAPKERRLSPIDRVSIAQTGKPYEGPVSLPRQLAGNAPQKNDGVKSSTKAVAPKKLVSEADEIAAVKERNKTAADNKAKLIASREAARKAAIAKLAAKKKQQ